MLPITSARKSLKSKAKKVSRVHPVVTDATASPLVISCKRKEFNHYRGTVAAVQSVSLF